VVTTFGPNDHEAVDSALLSIVVDGRWQDQPVSVRYDDL
jgi:hypothetical protein